MKAKAADLLSLYFQSYHIKLTLTLLGTFGLWGEGGALEPELPIRLACSCAV
jgi:hypothetical protein